MIIVLKPHTTEENINRVENLVKNRGLDTHVVRGTEMTIIGCIGDTTLIDPRLFEVDSSVDKVMHVQEPYKLANRAFHPEDSVIEASGVKFGGGHMGLIAGPCSVESYEQVLEVAKAVKAAGATMLRGGAFKPRTSPYSFQGLGLEGLDILCAVKEETGLPIVTELMSPQYLDVFNEKVDLIQIGARNMQNFDLLKQLGQIDRPILLKRGLNAPQKDPSPGSRGPEPCRRKMVARRADGKSSRGCRRRRPDDRSTQQPGMRTVRWRTVTEARKIRRPYRTGKADRRSSRKITLIELGT